MNRLLGIVPTDDAKAIAVAATVPMALRGAREVASYAPSSLPDASGDLMARVTQLYRGDDQLHRLWGEAIQTRELTDDLAKDNGRNAAATGALAARLLAPRQWGSDCDDRNRRLGYARRSAWPAGAAVEGPRCDARRAPDGTWTGVG